MRIAVMGAGSMGSAFGGKLAEAGLDVWLVDVWQEHVDAINRDGLRLGGVGGDRVVRAKATTDPARVGIADLVIVFVKSMETRAAAEAAVPMAGGGTSFLTLQNGLGNREVIASVVGEERVLSGVTFDSAALQGPGHVLHTNARTTLIGEWDGRATPRLERVVATFREAGFGVRVTDNARGEMWGKLLVNAVANATCVLTQYGLGELMAYDCSRQWVRLVGDEVASVAKALGLTLPYADPFEKMRSNWQGMGAAKPSMVQDVEKGRWTEIDFINGAVVREGARASVPAPYNLALSLMVQMIQARQHGEEHRT